MTLDTVAFKMPQYVADTVAAVVEHSSPHVWMVGLVMVVALLLLYHALRKMDE